MKLPNIKKNSRMQILIPMCAFVLVVIIVLLIIIPSTKDSVGKLQAVKTEAQEPAEEETEAVPVEQAAQSNEAAECTDSAINDFFRNYYNAMAEGNTEALDAMFDQPGYAATSEALSNLLDGYENIRVYTANGLHDGELAAFVYSDVKFANVSSSAPSMDSFYLSTGDGEPKIMTAMYTDPDIADYMTKLSKKNPVKSIMENTNFWLETTLTKDEDLLNIYNKMQEYISGTSGDE